MYFNTTNLDNCLKTKSPILESLDKLEDMMCFGEDAFNEQEATLDRKVREASKGMTLAELNVERDKERKQRVARLAEMQEVIAITSRDDDHIDDGEMSIADNMNNLIGEPLYI